MDKVKQLADELYNQKVLDGWKNVSMETCLKRATDYYRMDKVVKKLNTPDVGSSLPKVCKGCGTLSTKVIDKKYLACCPDNNYIPMEEYCKKAIYPDKQF